MPWFFGREMLHFLRLIICYGIFFQNILLFSFLCLLFFWQLTKQSKEPHKLHLQEVVGFCELHTSTLQTIYCTHISICWLSDFHTAVEASLLINELLNASFKKVSTMLLGKEALLCLHSRTSVPGPKYLLLHFMQLWFLVCLYEFVWTALLQWCYCSFQG